MIEELWVDGPGAKSLPLWELRLTIRLPLPLKLGMKFLGSCRGRMDGGERSTYLIPLSVSCRDPPHIHPAVLALLGHLAGWRVSGRGYGRAVEDT